MPKTRAVGDEPVLEAGVAFVVRDDRGRVLLHLRPEEDGWSPPSGTLRGGEALGATLEREILEETGLAVERVRLVAVHSDPRHQVMRTPDGQCTHFVTLVFTCRLARGEIDPGGDAADAAWAWHDPAALPRLTRFGRSYLEDALSDRDEVVVR
ncbi:MAG TPA: NUDIX domain-containing protein [Candidatus Limnocylindria bacterium]|nr:NUDIX domain-containing protein [Candidatus Limnocylindria bacterium]